MLKAQRHIIAQIHKVIDICLVITAFVCAYGIKKYLLPEPLRGLLESPEYNTVLLLVIIIFPVTFNYFGLYDSFRTQPINQVIVKIVKSIFTGVILVNFVMYLLKISDVSRIMMGIFLLNGIFFLTISKSIIYKTLINFRKQGYNYHNLVIIGGRERAKEIIRSINEKSGAGFRIVGCLGLTQTEIGKHVIGQTYYIGVVTQLKNVLVEHVVDQIIFALPLDLVDDIDRHITTAERLGVIVRIIPEWNLYKLGYGSRTRNFEIEDFLSIPTMCLSTLPSVGGELEIKNLLDFFGATLLIVFFFPIFLLVSISIKLFSKGPVLFTQERCGLNGRRFKLYKFRTMVIDAERMQKKLDRLNEADGPAFKIKKDPRIIPFIGPLLRKTGFDELPQLFNVIKGEMSLVGPRPPIPTEVNQYELWQRRRLSMRPGITCLWQCSKKRNDISFKEWMSLDLTYIDSWSLKLDFKILIKTALVVFTGQGR
jgi:exopolysaccharide biosynthesis polyprenyl glycosylphosphotransferase